MRDDTSTSDVQSGGVLDRLPTWAQVLLWILFPLGLLAELIGRIAGANAANATRPALP